MMSSQNTQLMIVQKTPLTPVSWLMFVYSLGAAIGEP
jgi:hypothetical protein